MLSWFFILCGPWASVVLWHVCRKQAPPCMKAAELGMPHAVHSAWSKGEQLVRYHIRKPAAEIHSLKQLVSLIACQCCVQCAAVWGLHNPLQTTKLYMRHVHCRSHCMQARMCPTCLHDTVVESHVLMVGYLSFVGGSAQVSAPGLADAESLGVMLWNCSLSLRHTPHHLIRELMSVGVPVCTESPGLYVLVCS